MTVKLDLKPEIEAGLVAQAHAHGLSLEAYLGEVLQTVVKSPEAQPHKRNLADFLLNSPFAGSDLNLERHQDYGRPVDL